MIAVITGASSGIGAETARALAAGGDTLILAARREKELLALSAECLTLGAPTAIPVPCDVVQTADCERLAFAAGSQPSQEVCLIHCAGTATFGPTLEMGVNSVRALIVANLVGYANVACSLLPLLVGNTPGRIVNISSIAAVQAFSGAAAYGAAKAGGLQFSACLRAEHRKEGLLVTDLILGATDTPLWDGANWKPNPADMLSAKAVAETIASLVKQPRDRAIDRLDLLPPLGVL